MSEQTRTCKVCGLEQPLNAEHFQPTNSMGRKFISECRECERQYIKAWQSGDVGFADHLKRRGQSWESWIDPSRLQQERERRIEFERLRTWLKSPEFSEHVQDALNRPEAAKRLAEREEQRNGYRKKATGWYTVNDVRQQYRKQKGCCCYCKKRLHRGNYQPEELLANAKYHIDHFYPLRKGGTNWPENIVIACPVCNLSKNDDVSEMWGNTQPTLWQKGTMT